MKKLKSQKGESLIETLTAVLVICLASLMLAGAIVTTAKINDKSQSDSIVNFENESDTANNSHESGTVTITFNGITQDESVTVYTQKEEGSSGGSDFRYYR